MNKGEFEGKWMQLRGQIRDWWGKLATDDLDRVAGNFDQFIGLLQEKYGYTRKRAEEEFYRRMALLRELRVEVEEEAKRRLAQHAARQQSDAVIRTAERLQVEGIRA